MNKQPTYIEGKYYSESKLYDSLNKNDLINLSLKGVLEPIDKVYKFNFVGIVSIRDVVFVVVPKILKSQSNLTSDITVKTLKKYRNNNSQLFEGIDYFNIEPDHPECSELAIAEFLIKDFQENGICRFEEELLRINGDGDINWDQTVSNIDPIYSRDQPIYINTINEITVDDHNNLTIAIHKWSLDYVSKKYLAFLTSDPISLVFDYEKDINKIGNIEQLINHLQKQILLIYSDREIRLIKSLIYLLKKKAGNSENSLSLFGTKKYENVWEAICKLVVNDNYKAGTYFSKPIWNILGEKFLSRSTLIPDITCEDPKTGNFYLFDAKYYSLSYLNKLSGEPSYKDILKQFQYQIHIEKKIEKQISNAFLLPLNDNEFENLKNNDNIIFYNDFMAVIGSISYDLFEQKKIWVIMCPFSKWQENYTKNISLEYTDVFYQV